MDIFEIIIELLFYLEIVTGVLSLFVLSISLISFIKSLVENISPYKGNNIYVDKKYSSYVNTRTENEKRIHRNYFFGPGYYQISRIFNASRKTANNWKNIIFKKNILIKIISYLLFFSLFIADLVGLLFLAVSALALLLPLVIGTICIFPFLSIPWLIEYAIMRIKPATNRCPYCKQKIIGSTAYKCKCDAPHKKLMPGPYGIFSRKCECGERLPTTYLGKKLLEKRNESHESSNEIQSGEGIEKIVPICPNPNCEGELFSSSQKYEIQLVGRTRTGKTTFLSAFMHEYKEFLKKISELTSKEASSNTNDFNQLEDWFQKGMAQSTSFTDAKKYSIIHSLGNNKVEMAIYDIAGEVFGSQDADRQQKQIGDSDGYLLMVDPKPGYENDPASFVSEGIATFIKEFDKNKGTHTEKMDSIPIAVVITKSDLFEYEIGLDTIREQARLNGIIDDSNSDQYQKFQSDYCRKFLINHEYGNVVNIIEGKFKNVRYFPVSAKGHNDNTLRYEPWGVLEPVFWLMSDKKCPLRGVVNFVKTENNKSELSKKRKRLVLNSINKKWLAISAIILFILISFSTWFTLQYINFRNSIYAPLFEAITFNNQNEVNNLIEKDRADLNYINFLGKTPLKLAISNNNEEMISFLVANGANVNLEDSWKWTPLEYAVSKGKKEIVLCLLNEGAEVNLEDSAGWTPLTHAISIGNGEMVSCLIKEGAGNNFEDSNGRTPLKYAIEIGDTNMISALLENGEDINFVDSKQYTPLLFAIEKNKLRPTKEEQTDDFFSMDYIKKFVSIKKGIKGNQLDYLKYIPHKYRELYKNNKNIISLLLEKGANPNLDLPNIETPLRFAVAKKDKDVISLLTEKNADINFVDSKKQTPLHRAILDESENMVNFLLEKGAEINHDVKNIETPLRYAISHDKKNMASHLIKDGATIDYLDKSRWTPIEYSISLNKKEMVSLLKDKGVGINAEDSRKKTPLIWAVYHNNAEMVLYLIELGANPNYFDSEGITPLKYAISKDKLDMIRPLIKNGANPDLEKDAKGNAVSTPLIYAIDLNKKGMIAQLIKSGANPNYFNSKKITPLKYAISNDKLEMIKPLIENGANPNLEKDTKGNSVSTPLIHAIDLNKKGMIAQLIKSGANPNYFNSEGITPLKYVINNDKLEMIKPLIENGANPNLDKDAKGNAVSTPLIHAIDLNKKDMIKVLKNNGADINYCDNSGWTPITYAIEKNNKDMVSYLIDYGAEKNSNENLAKAKAFTPLQYAIHNNNKEMITLLVNKGANINYGQFNYYTPLQYAIRSSTEDMVLYLIKEKKALVDYKASNGSTAMRVAIDAEKKNMISLLLKNGLKVNKAGADGKTPLENAIDCNKPQMVTYLIDTEDASATKKNNGYTPLEYAQKLGRQEIVKILESKQKRNSIFRW